jgi:bacterioferritin-associated ferredoxin
MRIVLIKVGPTMIVCICHRVSDRDIAAQARAGCPDFDVLQDETRAGTSCGACLDCARATWAAACATRAASGEAGRAVHRIVPLAA